MVDEISESPAPSGPVWDSLSPNAAHIPEGYTPDQWAATCILLMSREKDPAFDLTAVDPGPTITVYRADPQPDRLAAEYAAVTPPGVTLRFAQAVLSRSQQAQLLPVIDRETKRLKELDVRITQCGEQVPGGQFIIGYDPNGAVPDASLLEPFAIFGRDTVAFAPVERALPAIGSVGPTGPHNGPA